MQRRLAQAGAIIVVGAALLAAGEGLLGHVSWLAWPLIVLGGMILFVGVVWAPVAVGAPALLRPLAGAVAERIDPSRIAEAITRDLRTAYSPPTSDELREAVVEAIRAADITPRDYAPSAESIAAALADELEARRLVGVEEDAELRKRRQERRVLVHELIATLEGHKLDLESLTSARINTTYRGPWNDPDERARLQSEPAYNAAVRAVDRAFQAIGRTDPTANRFAHNQPKLREAMKAIPYAINELQEALREDE